MRQMREHALVYDSGYAAVRKTQSREHEAGRLGSRDEFVERPPAFGVIYEVALHHQDQLNEGQLPHGIEMTRGVEGQVGEKKWLREEVERLTESEPRYCGRRGGRSEGCGEAFKGRSVERPV